MQLLIIFGVGLLIGSILVFAIIKNQEFQIIRQAKLEADDIVSDAKDHGEELIHQAKESSQLEADEKTDKLKEDLAERWIEVKVQRKENSASESDLRAKVDEWQREYKGYQNRLKGVEKKISQKESKLRARQEQVDQLRKDFIQEIESNHGLNKDSLAEQRCAELEKEYIRATDLSIKADMEWLRDEAEIEAKKIMMIGLNRFSREYCGERGLSAIQFPSPKVADRFFNAKYDFKSEIETLCGVDLVFDEDSKSIAVAGFDPVRRELARRILLKMVKDGRAPTGSIKSVYQKSKKELFNQIQKDGNRIAKELGLRNLHTEIRKMMGCLRYRYSFSQNQYFHCSEVGWLCGLLATELGLPIYDARRSGMLHDIGKSMDHSIEGGHAVIGADFIEKYGEKEHIIHNVRAHHFDVQPDTDTAFLVIGADALSGGRPGARRSTIDSYNQKILELESIGNSFEGVLSTYIVHGGREVRVIADGEKVNDVSAVEMSKQIAEQIEETCNYPGQIKVVVVRESVAVQVTQGA